MNGAQLVETSHVAFLNLPPVWVLVLVVAPALVLGCRWLYLREPVEGRGRWLGALLRCLVLALLLVFLFRPVRLTQRVRVEKPVGAVLVDDSASLRERDMPGLAEQWGLAPDATRSEVVRAVLAPPLARFEERYETHLFAFGETLRAIGSLDDLAAADGSTRLGDAFAALAAEMRGRDLAQVILVTDGKSNSGRDPEGALASLAARGVPLTVLGVGDAHVPRDVRLGSVTAPEVALVGDTVTLEVSVVSRGFPGSTASAVVKDRTTGLELVREAFVIGDGVGLVEQVVRISFEPEREGDLDLSIAVEPLAGERDRSNNVERRALRVEPGRIKVLYVDGYPRYEYRFLKNSLLRIRNLEAQCLLLSADKDFIQESSRGVDALTAFPPELKDLLDYHVIIFGDVRPEDLGPRHEEYLKNIKAFVEAGGGFLMQAGAHHSPRDYVDTPIADILPVLIGDWATERAAMDDSTEPFRPVLTRPRDPHEVVRLLDDAEANAALWMDERTGLAPLQWYYPVAKARTTARVLLQHPRSRNAHGPHVLLATMYAPAGRTAFLATDETWRWRLLYLETYREAFWRGLVRFLALNKLRRSDYRFELSTDRTAYDIGQRIAVSARVRGADFELLDAPSVGAVVVHPDGKRENLTLARREAGVFWGELLPAEPGPYRLWLEDPLEAGSVPLSPRAVTVSLPAHEKQDAVLDEPFLRRVATQGGGRYVHLSDAVKLLDRMADPARERPLDEPRREEVWAGMGPLGLLVALLACEWILRKRQNLI